MSEKPRSSKGKELKAKAPDSCERDVVEAGKERQRKIDKEPYS